jgi:hypothetical protein
MAVTHNQIVDEIIVGMFMIHLHPFLDDTSGSGSWAITIEQ